MRVAFVCLGRENLGVEYLSAVSKAAGHEVQLAYDPGLFSENDNVFLKTEGPDPTVFDDAARDLLTGSSGLDWFIFNSDEDKATDLSDAEFEDALNFILSDV